MIKFGPELTKRTEKNLGRVGGKWRYLWRAVDANGQLIGFRLTARRDAKAAKAFLNKAIERVRPHRPVTIVTDKAPTYRRVIRDITINTIRISTASDTLIVSGETTSSKAITRP